MAKLPSFISDTRLPYVLYMLAMLAFVGAIVATPYIALQDRPTGEGLQAIFAPTCHQIEARSLCVTPSGIEDCPTPASGKYGRDFMTPLPGGGFASKFPVCSRDLAIYFTMLLGGAVFPLLFKVDTKKWPNKWVLVAACVPIAVDGGTQIIGLRESSNFLRLLTGAIVGFALPFYIIPILNSIFSAVMERVKRKASK